MIALLTGKIVERDFSSCLIDVRGVGYEVLIPLSTFDRLPLNDETVTLFIHTQVREDAITLFGFATKEEKTLLQDYFSSKQRFKRMQIVFGSDPSVNSHQMTLLMIVSKG